MLGLQGLLSSDLSLFGILKTVGWFICYVFLLFWNWWGESCRTDASNVPFLWYYTVWTVGKTDFSFSQLIPTMGPFSREIILCLDIVNKINLFKVNNNEYFVLFYVAGSSYWYALRKQIDMNRNSAQDDISWFSS